MKGSLNSGRHSIVRWMVIYFLLVTSVSAEVLSQWRGPNRDGHYPASNLLKKWPADGPPVLWRANDLGEGFTSAAVTDDHVFVTGMHGDLGYVYAFDHSGKLLYKKAYGAEWKRNYPGTRSTPLVVDNLIYLESGRGVIYCLRAKDGSEVWSLDLLRTFNSENIPWGMTEQLLVDGDMLFCTPGGPKVSVAALNRFTGKVLWTTPGNGELSSYCSPILVNHNSIRMLITMLAKSVIAVDAGSGELLWRHPFPAPYDIHANAAIYWNGSVYVQSGEGGDGMLLKIAKDGRRVTEVWRNNNMDTLIGHAVLVDGYIYGAGWPRRGFQALNWQTGKATFENRGFSRSSVIFADGHLYVYSEKGTLALVKPNPKKFDLVSTMDIDFGAGRHWAHPVIANGRLYIRHGDELRVFSIAAK